MKILIEWLKDFVPVSVSPEKLADTLTNHSFETKVVADENKVDLSSIVVGEVLSVKKHPNADKLSLTETKIGNKTFPIVCGAPNVRAGLKVAVALPGVKVLADKELIEIKEAVIRGEKSEGMLCSERELGLGEGHSGILELASNTKVGITLAKLFPKQAVIDAEVLPDRAADCSSHVGLAREVGAVLGSNFKLPKYKFPNVKGNAPFKVVVPSKEVCHRYVAVLIENIKNEPSPDFIQRRLRGLGLNPQNLIVDVTNYVLFEVGQPTHAFDARAIGKTLSVRESKEGEMLTTLDGVERKLPEGALVIVSDDKPVALAGIMGGKESSIKQDTTSIILEVALFPAFKVRQAANVLGLKTDASNIFSKGLTSYHVTAGVSRVVELLQEYGDAKVTALQDVDLIKEKPVTVELDHEQIENVIGTKVPPSKVKGILKSLGFAFVKGKKDYAVQSPAFRRDITIPENVTEEVSRMIGYDNLAVAIPSAPLAPAVLPDFLKDIRRIQDAMKGAGWMETYNYSFMGEEETRVLQLDKIESLKLVNPMNREQVRLRLSLLPNLLHSAAIFVKREPLVKMFEFGHVYPAKGEEVNHFGGMIVRRGEVKANDFYEAKGAVENALEELKISDVWFDPTEISPKDSFLNTWQEGASAEIKCGQTEIGFIGMVSEDVLKKLNIRGGIVAFEIDMKKVSSLKRVERVYNPPLPFPTVQRDISLLVPEGILIDQIQEMIEAGNPELIQDVDFVDMYDEDKANKSVTLRVVYGSKEKTLTDQEVNKIQEKIIADLETNLKIVVKK